MQTVTARCSGQQNVVSAIVKKPNLSTCSVAVCAACLFIIVNVAFSIGDSNQERKKGAYLSCQALTKAFKNNELKPSLVLLGSSLMRMPFWLADRLHTDFVPDYSHYCQNFSLQNILRRAGFKNSIVLDGAVDGEIVSDAFLISKKLFETGNRPEWIVYGIAPRDLSDSLLSNETRTPIFDSLFTFADIWLQRNGFVIDQNEKLSLTLEKLLFFFDKRKQVQNELTNLYGDLLYRTFSIRRTGDQNSTKKLHTLESAQKSDLWNKSIEEYQKRYRNFNDKQLAKQQLFLKDLCQNCANNGTKILLVNMPLTKENLALLPAGAYAKYHDAIQIAKQIKGVYLLDLQDRSDFQKMLYRDSAHLNEKGAHFLSMIISDTLRTITSSHLTQSEFSSLLKNQSHMPDGIASWWLAKEYFANPTPPEVVILGSSQLGPLLGTDAYVYKKLIDVTGDHQSQVLEHDLYALLNKKWKVFIGALPNAMISDQFIISRALFSNQQKPKLVAITFSPRDFIDPYYNKCMDTEAYTFFSKYASKDKLFSLRDVVKHNCNNFVDPQNADYKYFAGVSPLTLGKPFERLCPGELTINSIDGCVVQDNTEEYRSRYQSPFSQQLTTQMNYFDSLLKYLAQQHIQVVAFNLPLRADNKKLLPDSFWKYYDDRVSEICRINGADYVSVDRVVLPFKDSEFFDGTHLNLAGGDRLSKTIALFTANTLRLKTFQELLANDKYLQ